MGIKSGLISLLIFIVIGPLIGLLIVIGPLIHPFTIIPAYILGGPVAALTGLIFIAISAAASKGLKLSNIWYGSGAIIGGISGLIAATLSQLLPGKIHNAADIYLFCGLAGALCGAIRCLFPIDLEKFSRKGSSN